MQDALLLCVGWNDTQNYRNLLGPCQEREVFSFLFSVASELVQEGLRLKGAGAQPVGG